jgi:alanyl-tRNA synthetase
MTTDQIRLKFLDFFKSKGHAIVPSDSLVPKDDPTVLFTTAGMQQFKPQFMGRDLTYRTAATCQKCLRTDDLDVVGKTDFHHTFFEMLGNFSFGDYFKKEAIAWGWEFLTRDLKLPQDKLWVSVYKDDDEAYGIWQNDIKMPTDRIVRLGDKSNFWPSNARLNGPNGPCGPCSEIFYDYGVNPECPKGKDCDPDCSCGRFSEIWNLVFTQFNRKDGGVLEPLPAKNIDTGMGLERLAAVVQGKKSNYETDNLSVILSGVKAAVSSAGGKMTESESRIIADHIRAVTFGIADGVVPTNEGRGYVMRKLIIDMTDLVVRAGIQQPLVHTFVDMIISTMKGPYPEVVPKAQEIKDIIKRIEEGFIKVRRERVPELKDRILKNINDEKDLGDTFFLYRDTHGLTLSTILGVAQDVTIQAPVLKAAIKVYEAKMKEQKDRSRSSSKMTGDVFADTGIKLDVPKTEFLGYHVLEVEAKVLKVFGGGEHVKVILNHTPFYAESGGQLGDSGYITTDNAVVRVTDTQKIDDIFIHEGRIEEGKLSEGDHVIARVDAERRQAMMRNHTATHLLQAALREILGAHIKQQGSLVAPERLRFDFVHPGGLKPEQMQAIENRIKGFITQKNDVVTDVLSLEEAKKRGALAFFAEKYGHTVRVVSIGDYSKEFCGGTHVPNTEYIEDIKIVSEGSVAQGIRRIEAVTGSDAVHKFLNHQQELAQEKLRQQELREKEKQEQNARFEQIKVSVGEYLTQAQRDGRTVITKSFEGIDMGMLRKLSDLCKQRLSSGVFILGARTPQDASLIVSVTEDLVSKGLKANELVAEIAPLFAGTGGGRPQMAQAGSKQPDKLDGALSKAKEIVEQKLQAVR